MKYYKIKKSNIDNKGLYASRNIKAKTKIIILQRQNYYKKGNRKKSKV